MHLAAATWQGDIPKGNSIHLRGGRQGTQDLRAESMLIGEAIP